MKPDIKEKDLVISVGANGEVYYGICNKIEGTKIFGQWNACSRINETSIKILELKLNFLNKKFLIEGYSDKKYCEVIESPANLNILVEE